MKVDVEKFNMVNRSLSLDIQLARTYVLKLGYFCHFHFFANPRLISMLTCKDAADAANGSGCQA